jgi:hypothetical protein
VRRDADGSRTEASVSARAQCCRPDACSGFLTSTTPATWRSSKQWPPRFLAGKVGEKRLTIFVQFEQGLKSVKIKPPQAPKAVVECFVNTGWSSSKPSRSAVCEVNHPQIRRDLTAFRQDPDFGSGSILSILECPRHVWLSRTLGNAQRPVLAAWRAHHRAD